MINNAIYDHVEYKNQAILTAQIFFSIPLIFMYSFGKNSFKLKWTCILLTLVN